MTDEIKPWVDCADCDKKEFCKFYKNILALSEIGTCEKGCK